MFNKFGNLILSLHLSFSCNQKERVKKAPHISNLHYRFIRKDIKKNIVMGVKAGKAYESEVKIAKEIIKGGIELNGEYFILLGDKA